MSNMIVNKLRLSVLLMAIGLSAPVLAGNEAMLDLLGVLKDKGNISEKEHDALVKAAQAEDEVEKAQATINTKGKLEFVSPDKRHKFRLGGRLQWDTTLVQTDGTYDDQAGSSETQLRRARLYLSGTTHQFWDFKFQFDFEDADDGDQVIEDAYVRYTAWPIHLTLGQRKTPFSMEGLTSSKYIAFIERSMATALFTSESSAVGGRAPGITLTYKWRNLLAEGGYYLTRTPGGGESDIDDGQGVTGRLVWGKYDKQARTLLHVGMAGGFKKYANGSVDRMRVRPNVSEGARIIDTRSALPADSYYAFNLQLATMYERYWFGGEYYYGQFDINDPTRLGGEKMNGYYIQAGAFLTDDARRYKNGAWGSVKPRLPLNKGGIGAWEVALRYDGATLDAALNSDGEQQDGNTLSAALNWYPINNVRLQGNYVKVFCDTAPSTCAFGEGEPSFFVLRGQIFF